MSILIALGCSQFTNFVTSELAAKTIERPHFVNLRGTKRLADVLCSLAPAPCTAEVDTRILHFIGILSSIFGARLNPFFGESDLTVLFSSKLLAVGDTQSWIRLDKHVLRGQKLHGRKLTARLFIPNLHHWIYWVFRFRKAYQLEKIVFFKLRQQMLASHPRFQIL
ncbi:unnamed protein product [Arabis nemorensis]|uniref:Uncharacterized protein n=1 Tax=Arabis nemorensis TaxID=586526 RepID=A0A565CM39_9BRAS|nr:unnamed protein product [Arabis nemorensis]